MRPLERWLLEVFQLRAAMAIQLVYRSAAAGWPPGDVERALRRLVAAGWLEPAGKAGGISYRLTDAGWRVGPAGDGELLPALRPPLERGRILGAKAFPRADGDRAPARDG